ncbi:asparagine synthase-related protein [Amycolatopsis sp. EV170708-02-1]|uniref:asparagine synthase-related protein n=1 Tax=Amycolatopsis sp. EV170708-02-1 TaxID=2919322 RepID=UPI001F0C3E26|nr:asparagine synthase-related protein [Amycolatopsis sp. EV170708-02-1]UMP07074.1 asparagine synthase C-terminal domain-containing protein [Amycolatopsis sp. EV170708-02-1]
MLSFHLTLNTSTDATWHWDTDRWRRGESWIQPVAHPALRHDIDDRPGATTVLVRDAASPLSLSGTTQYTDVDAGMTGDALLLRIQPGRITLTAGIGGTVPLYLAVDGDTLHGTWDLPALRRLTRRSGLLDRAVVRALTRRHRYSSDTLFTDTTMLTERATATFTASGLKVAYPAPASHITQARHLRSGVDATAALTHLLTDAVRPWQDRNATLGLELSGGLDSATIAVAARTASPAPLRTFGLIVDGALGAEQHRRRVTIARQVGAMDYILAAHDHAPFCENGIRASGTAHDPRGEFYREAFEALADQAARSGVEIMLTGNGGDEIMAPRVDELPPPPPQPLTDIPWLGPRARDAVAHLDDNLAPSAVLPTPTLMGFAIHHPAYLRSGIWPVAPFTHRPLIRFAEQLPLALRRHKKLYRDFLAHAGLPPLVTHPRRTEHFRDLMQHGLRHNGLRLAERLLADGMLLVDQGFIDPDALRRTVQHAHQSATVPSVLCDTLVLEVGLRSLQAPTNTLVV